MRAPEDQTARATCKLASVTPVVLNHLADEKPLFLESGSCGDATYVMSETSDVDGIFDNLTNIAGEDLMEHRYCSKEEIERRGYNSDHVKKLAIFPRDGNYSPYLDRELDRIVENGGGEVCDRMALKKILVKPTWEGDDVRVTRIVWEDTTTGELNYTLVKSLYLSLGPSMRWI